VLIDLCDWQGSSLIDGVDAWKAEVMGNDANDAINVKVRIMPMIMRCEGSM